MNFKNQKIQYFDELKYFIGLTLIPVRCFDEQDTLCSVTIPKNVQIIGDQAFQRSLRGQNSSITIPEGVTTIGEQAFVGTKIHKIKLPSSILRLGSNCFGSNDLEEIEVPEGVIEIPEYFVDCCTDLKKIKLPSSITKIGAYAFAECYYLEEINIPDNVEDTGEQIFGDYSIQLDNLKKVYMSSNCKCYQKIMKDLRTVSKNAVIVDPNNQNLLKQSGLVESTINQGNKETNITNSQGQDVPELGKHAENVYLPDCPFMIGKEQVDWFEYFQREKEKHTIKDVDDFIASAKKETELIK